MHCTDVSPIFEKTIDKTIGYVTKSGFLYSGFYCIASLFLVEIGSRLNRALSRAYSALMRPCF